MNIFDGLAEGYERRMHDIRSAYEDDPEVCHQKMDECLCDILEELEFYGVVRIFKETEKYYA